MKTRGEGGRGYGATKSDEVCDESMVIVDGIAGGEDVAAARNGG